MWSNRWWRLALGGTLALILGLALFLVLRRPAPSPVVGADEYPKVVVYKSPT